MASAPKIRETSWSNYSHDKVSPSSVPASYLNSGSARQWRRGGGEGFLP